MQGRVSSQLIIRNRGNRSLLRQRDYLTTPANNDQRIQHIVNVNESFAEIMGHGRVESVEKDTLFKMPQISAYT